MPNTIKIIKKGITSLNVDCIVNAANSDLWEGSGVCGAIFKAAGPRWNDGNHREPQKLYSCYQASIRLAEEYHCHSIGFLLISA